MNFIEELKWRGMLHDVMPGTEEQLQKEMTTAYVGIDPTADSLHIGHLVSVMILKHLQYCGHKPLALMGGATGMVGDPSFKAEERKLLSKKDINHNVACIRKQLEKFLDFESGENSAEILNNYDWIKDYLFLDFIRDIGKHITINYMMAKDSVKKRLDTGLSFTEFSYQLLQGFDFLHLYETKNCKLQMGGSDQWGNITTGTELIRRKTGGEAFALTCPLITKADGTKFGKTESGNIWLDPDKTTPYAFYQFWLNCSDVDAKRYIRIFTLLPKQEIEELEKQHDLEPHLRILQKTLAKDITIRVHSESDYEAALQASEILFGKGTTDMLKSLDEKTFLSVFEGVPQYRIAIGELNQGIPILSLLTEKSAVFPSKNEARRSLKESAIMINKVKVTEESIVSAEQLLSNKYILLQKGKKNYYLVIAE